MKKKSVLLSITGYSAHSAAYVYRSNLSVAASMLQPEGTVMKAQIGWLSNVFFIIYPLGQLFNNCLGDRLKARNMARTGLLPVGIYNVMIGALLPFAAVFVLWAINGYVQSMVWGLLLRAISAFFSKEKGRYIASLLISSVVAESVIRIVLASSSAPVLRICFTFALSDRVTLVVYGTVILLFRIEEPAKTGKRSLLEQLFLEPKILSILLPATIYGVLKGSINLRTPLYLVQMLQTSISGMAFYVLITPVISLVGQLIYPVIYRTCYRREYPVTTLALGVPGVVLMPLCAGADSTVLVVCLSLVAATTSVVNILILGIYPMDLKEDGSVSFATGVMNFATYMGAGINSAIYGYALEYNSFEIMYVPRIVLCLVGIMILVRSEEKYGYEKISDSR